MSKDKQPTADPAVEAPTPSFGNPTDYQCQMRLSYSDDSGQACEQSFLFKPEVSYNDFMKKCARMYETIAYTFGDKFQDITKDASPSK